MKVRVVELDAGKIAEAEEALKEYPGASRKAIHDALRRMKSHINKHAKKEIPNVYDISAQNLQKEGTVKQRIKYTPGDGIEALTMFNGELIELYKFNPTPLKDTRQDKYTYIRKGNRRVRVSPSITTKAHLAKNSALKTIPNVFVAGMKNKNGSVHMGVFERTGKWTKNGNEAIRELTGNSIAHMVDSSEIAEEIISDAQKAFHARLDSNVQRIREGKWKI